MLACVFLFEVVFVFILISLMCFIGAILGVDDFRHGNHVALVHSLIFAIVSIIGFWILLNVCKLIQSFNTIIISNAMLISIGLIGLMFVIVRLQSQREDQIKKRVQD